MGNEVYRPWGLLSWVNDKLPGIKWDFLGCLGTEERSLECYIQLHGFGQIRASLMTIVNDPPSDYTKITNDLLFYQKRKLIDLTSIAATDIQELDLFATTDEIYQLANAIIARSEGNVLLDISSFPKRIFFPLVKFLVRSDVISNLLVTYTVPASYCKGALAESPDTWAAMPAFGPASLDKKVEIVLLGVGFIPFGLPDLLKNQFNDAEVRLLFPFPPGPPMYQRSWEFVREIEKDYTLSASTQLQRLDAYDVSDAFDHIRYFTRFGAKNCLLAPYGPKPISLSMCLFSIQTGCPVFYTQPAVYNPQYSRGVKKSFRGDAEIYSYCIKMDGKNLYQLN